MTGGGRCNVTNNRPVDDLVAHIPGNGKFLYSTFSQFNNYDVMAFFADLGVVLKEEDHGRMFPVTNKSKTIVEALLQAINDHHVTLLTNTVVTKLIHDGSQIRGVRTETDEFSAPSVILTTGGRTYPSTGATGDGYKMAKKVGHTITPLYPTESPLVSEESFIQERTLQGISLQDITLSVLDQKRKAYCRPYDGSFVYPFWFIWSCCFALFLLCKSRIEKATTRNGCSGLSAGKIP